MYVYICVYIYIYTYTQIEAMCNSMKIVPAAELAKQAVEAGEQVVISIWATGEARL